MSKIHSKCDYIAIASSQPLMNMLASMMPLLIDSSQIPRAATDVLYCQWPIGTRCWSILGAEAVSAYVPPRSAQPHRHPRALPKLQKCSLRRSRSQLENRACDRTV